MTSTSGSGGATANVARLLTWFGFGWSATDLAVLAAYAVLAGVPALWLFRWD